jgi:plasmid maintenance system antidote protein VapI
MKMIGLEYILSLYNVSHVSLAEELGIKRQNINLWIKGKGKIPKKYLPVLSKKFRIDEKYFQKELGDLDKLAIQRIKIKIDQIKIEEQKNEHIMKDPEVKARILKLYGEDGVVDTLNFKDKAKQLQEREVYFTYGGEIEFSKTFKNFQFNIEDFKFNGIAYILSDLNLDSIDDEIYIMDKDIRYINGYINNIGEDYVFIYFNSGNEICLEMVDKFNNID